MKTAGTIALLVALAFCATRASGAPRWKAHSVPGIPSASHPAGYYGVVRVINHSDEGGEVVIDAFDDAGVAHGPLTLALGAREAVQLNSDDLERGNLDKGLAGSTGTGPRSWRLRLRSSLDLEVLAYNRTGDGLLQPLHDLVPLGVVRRPGAEREEMGHRVGFFPPAGDAGGVGALRLVNRGAEAAAVRIEGIDEAGASSGGAVELTLEAGASRSVTSAALESGSGEGLSGRLGDGEGSWQLVVTSDRRVEVVHLLASPGGHLANLSTAPGAGTGKHEVPWFAAAGNAAGHRGVVRIINRSDTSGEVRIEAFDHAGDAYGPVTLALAAGETVHLDSDDLERGNTAKGLAGSTGAGAGDWRLRLDSSLAMEVLAWNRSRDGLLSPMHDVVPAKRVVRPGEEGYEERHVVGLFSPGSGTERMSRLRLVNPAEEAATVRIEGIDDAGASPGSGVEVEVPAHGARTLTAQALESGAGLRGGLGDGDGWWRLVVTSDTSIAVMSLLSSPAGHLTNLSTAGAPGEPLAPPASAARATVVEVTGRGTASAGTQVVLRASPAGTDAVAIERYEWEFSDGQRGSGQEVSVRFADAGLYDVTVRAMRGADVVASGEWAVAVFDALAGASPGLEGIPAVFGDMDGDGRVGPEDLARLKEVLAGERALTSAVEEAGDLDLSGVVDGRDAALFGQMLGAGTALPSALLDASAYPGGVVAVVSASLLDPDTDVRVYVDSAESPQVLRTILGYATFAVPASLAGTGAEVEVAVTVDGMVTERLGLVLKPALTLDTDDARADVRAFFDDVLELLASQEDAGRRFVAEHEALSSDDLPDADVAVVFGATTAAARALRAAVEELEAALDGEGGAELAAHLQAQLYANGLVEFRERLAAFAAPAPSAGGTGGFGGRLGAFAVPAPSAGGRFGPTESASWDPVCDEYVPALCKLKEMSNLVDDAVALTDGGCAVIGVLSFAYPLAALTVATACLKIKAALTVAQLVGNLVQALSRLEVRLISDKTELRAGETATISVGLEFFGLEEVCGFVYKGVRKEFLENSLIKTMTRKVAKILLRKSFILKKLPKKLFGDKTLVDWLADIIGATVGQALSEAGLNDAFVRFVKSLCDPVDARLIGGENELILKADAGRFGLRASAGAVLTRKADEPREYVLSCPAGFSGTVTVCGSKEICGEDKRGKVQVACGPGPVLPCCAGPPRDEDEGNEEVRIPDPGLRALVARQLGQEPGRPITRAQMQGLQSLGDPIASNDPATRGRLNIRDLKGLEYATQLEGLYLYGSRIGDLSPLKCLSDLKALRLDDSGITDVSTLSDLTSLEWLSLGDNQITDISPLSDLTALKVLLLDHNQVMDVSALSGLTSLEWLSLNNNQITDISPLSDLTGLKWLLLEHNQLTDLSLSDLTSLEYLNLEHNRITDLSLSGLAALKWLLLEHKPMTDISLSGLKALKTLILDEGQITNVSLSDLTSLEYLSLGDNQITDLSLSDLPSLEYLGLSSNQITDLSPLSGLTALSGLDLTYNQITDVSALSGLTALKNLYLYNNQITDISPLSGLTALRGLNLAYNQITDVSALSGLTALEGLNLYNNDISYIGPLVSNAGLGRGDSIILGLNPIGCSSLRDYETLWRRGALMNYSTGYPSIRRPYIVCVRASERVSRDHCYCEDPS